MAKYTLRADTAMNVMRLATQRYGDEVRIVRDVMQVPDANGGHEYEIVVEVPENAPVKQKKFSQEDLNNAITQARAKHAKGLKEQPKNAIKAYQSLQTPLPSSQSNDDDDAVEAIIDKAVKELGGEVKPNLQSENFNLLARQIKEIKEQVELISDITWESLAAHRGYLPIPPEFASIYKASKASGMKPEHLDAIMRATIENMPSVMKSNPSAVKRYFYSLLRNMLPCRSAKMHSRQRIMMLVGPTGVGKTTTLAKLAARFVHGHQDEQRRYKTGIITLDTYRIGAVEQLAQYTRLMRIEMLDVIKVEDFQSAIKSLSYCDIILVDTTGSSPHDKEKLLRLDKFLKHSNADIDVSLVLSAGAKVDDLIQTYNSFSFLDIDTLIITKFDETKMFGNVFSLIYETKTPVSYFCVGQDVPDDIRQATSEYLARCVLEGFSKEM